MSTFQIPDFLLEPERYELHEAWLALPEVNRRDFFRIAGAGVVVALLLGEGAVREAAAQGRGGATPTDLGAWLRVGEDGIVTVYTGKVEIGQNARTALTQVVAEELHTPLNNIRMVIADT